MTASLSVPYTTYSGNNLYMYQDIRWPNPSIAGPGDDPVSHPGGRKGNNTLGALRDISTRRTRFHSLSSSSYLHPRDSAARGRLVELPAMPAMATRPAPTSHAFSIAVPRLHPHLIRRRGRFRLGVTVGFALLLGRNWFRA